MSDLQKTPPSTLASKVTEFTLVPYQSFGIERDTASLSTSAHLYHYHDCFELYYLYSGECYSFIKDRSYHVQRGNIILVNDYDIHCTHMTERSPYDRTLLYFKKDFLSGHLESIQDMNLFECFKKNIQLIKLNSQEQHYIETLLQSMMSERQNHEPGYLSYLKTALIQLLIFLNRHNDQLNSNQLCYANSSHKTISEITGYINNNYEKDLTLASISDLFFISPSCFSRTFKKNTGFTFIEYLNGVRVKEAQKLLRQTDLSIAEIAEAVGYKSNTHFGRIFKSVTGISPLSYKKRSIAAASNTNLLQPLV